MWGWGGAAGRWGLVWQQAPIRQLESASAFLAICPPPPGSRPPSAYHRRACNSLRREGAEPGREGRRSPILPLFIPISSSAPAQGTSCQVHEKFAVWPPSAVVCGVVVGRKGGCVQFPFRCSSVCLTGDLRPHPPSCPSHYFPFFLALICKSAPRAGQLSCYLGSFAHHPPPAS